MILAMGLGDQNLYDRLKDCRKLGMSGIPPMNCWTTWKTPPGHRPSERRAARLGSGPVAIQHCDISRRTS